MKEQLKITGTLDIYLNGKLKVHQKNMIVTAGKDWVTARLKDATPSDLEMSYMAVGTDSTAAAAGQTALLAELDRNALSTAGGTVSTNTITYDCTWAAGDGTGALTEAGIFNDPSAGTMAARTVFSTINKGAGDTVTISWVWTIS